MTITEISKSDTKLKAKAESLLKKEGIDFDENLEYTVAAVDDDYNVIATGSCFYNTLRCLAVDSAHRSEGLLNEIVSHLVEYEQSKGRTHLFLYTKENTARFFESLGFYEIARVKGRLVFMENRKTGFEEYLSALEKQSDGKPAAAIVMNANPFTNGHLHLVKKALEEYEALHLFIVSEDLSEIPFAIRKQLVKEGTANSGDIIYHECGSYLISSATFPCYFLGGSENAVKVQAALDTGIFSKIALSLNIKKRFAGSEPTDKITAIYNETMQNTLPKKSIEFEVVKRLEIGGVPVSASEVRRLLKSGNAEKIKTLVPESTYRFFCSDEGKNLGNSEKPL